MTVKRGEGQPLISLDDLLARERADQEPSHKIERGSHLRATLGINILEQVLTRLRAEYEALANCRYSIA